jgi:predicted nucleotidyltransferase
MGVKDEVLQEIVRRILSVEAPERIILFGSAATGQMTRDSDVDLLLLVEDVSHAREQSVRWRQAIGDLGFPFDILVMRVERFEQTKDLVGGLAYPAHHHGKVIYAHP